MEGEIVGGLDGHGQLEAAVDITAIAHTDTTVKM